MSAKRKDAGFSLIEVLVALTIGAIVVATTISTMSLGVTRTIAGQTELAATSYARSLMARWSVGELKALEGGDNRFDWTITTSPFGAMEDAVAGGVRQVSVRVSWNDNGKQREFVLNSLERRRSDQ